MSEAELAKAHEHLARQRRPLVGRKVSLVIDCDRAGRAAAIQIARDLRAAGVHGSIIDLAPGREDGYDLSDWFSDHRDWPVEPDPRSVRPPSPGGFGGGVG